MWLSGRASLCEALDSMSWSVKQTHQDAKPQKEPETIPAIVVGAWPELGGSGFDSSLCFLTLYTVCSHPKPAPGTSQSPTASECPPHRVGTRKARCVVCFCFSRHRWGLPHGWSSREQEAAAFPQPQASGRRSRWFFRGAREWEWTRTCFPYGRALPILPCVLFVDLLRALPRLALDSVASSCLSLLRAEIAGVCGHAWLVLPSEEICCSQLRA